MPYGVCITTHVAKPLLLSNFWTLTPITVIQLKANSIQHAKIPSDTWKIFQANNLQLRYLQQLSFWKRSRKSSHNSTHNKPQTFRAASADQSCTGGTVRSRQPAPQQTHSDSASDESATKIYRQLDRTELQQYC